MKRKKSRTEWYANSAMINIKIHDRIRKYNYKKRKNKDSDNNDDHDVEQNGSTLLHHFDGTTMKKYQTPHKIFETIHCQEQQTRLNNNVNGIRDNDNECGSLDFDHSQIDVPLSLLQVRISSIGQIQDGDSTPSSAGRGLYTSTDIPKGASIGKEDTIYPVYFNPSSVQTMYLYSENDVKEIDKVLNYADGYGWQSATMGLDSYYVEPNFLTFVNHGCNGSYNVDTQSSMGYKNHQHQMTEQTVTQSDFPTLRPQVYSPYLDRHLHHKEVMWNEAIEDIPAGNELLSDYLFYTTYDADAFHKEAQVLKRICNGQEFGSITMNEMMND